MLHELEPSETGGEQSPSATLGDLRAGGARPKLKALGLEAPEAAESLEPLISVEFCCEAR